MMWAVLAAVLLAALEPAAQHALVEPKALNTAQSAETSRRLGELAAWAASIGDDLSGLLGLMAHPALNSTINGAIALAANGSRLSDEGFKRHAESVYAEHYLQNEATRTTTARKWSGPHTPPLLGNVSMWDLLKLLHFTVDNTDAHLKYTSQLIHCLQVYAMAHADRTVDPRFETDPTYRDDMLVAALVHDLGKSLSLFGESDGNVDCMNRVTSLGGGGGLDAIEFQFNHDHFGWMKLNRNVARGRLRLPQRVLDVVNYHSLREMGGLNVTSIGGIYASLPPRYGPLPEWEYVQDQRREHRSTHGRTTGGSGGVSAHSISGGGAEADRTVRMAFVSMLADGDVVSEDEQAAFNGHVSSVDDLRRAAFVQHFGYYDYYSKNQSDIIPQVDVQEIQRLLRKYVSHDDLIVEW